MVKWPLHRLSDLQLRDKKVTAWITCFATFQQPELLEVSCRIEVYPTLDFSIVQVTGEVGRMRVNPMFIGESPLTHTPWVSLDHFLHLRFEFDRIHEFRYVAAFGGPHVPRRMWVRQGRHSRRTNLTGEAVSCDSLRNLQLIPWAPKTMKNKGFGHLKTRLFTIKTSKNVGLGGPW